MYVYINLKKIQVLFVNYKNIEVILVIQIEKDANSIREINK